jgi:GNAT superfamily N-acetyltransferase
MTVSVRLVESLTDQQIDELAEILVAVVEQGASVGYLPPLSLDEARDYWRGVPKPSIRLLIAERDSQIVGTAQLELATKLNGRHRAEVNKVLVHPGCQRQGIGRHLMTEIESIARAEGRTLLHLDTREGDTSNDVYAALGWVEAGRIPRWARSAGGTLDGTVLYYKLLE